MNSSNANNATLLVQVKFCAPSHFGFGSTYPVVFVQSLAELLSVDMQVNWGSAFLLSHANESELSPRNLAEFKAIERACDDMTYGNSYPRNAWRMRESARCRGIANPAYEKPCATVAKYFSAEHYAHLPTSEHEDKSLIAYTESEEKGQRDKQTLARLGKVLKKLHPDMSDADIQAVVQVYIASQGEQTYTLQVTTDKELIRAAYETQVGNAPGCTSCMFSIKNRVSNWAEKPWDVYADCTDVALAIMRNADNEIAGRTVVVNKYNRKGFVRIYVRTHSDQQGREHERLTTVMERLLDTAGYTSEVSLLGCQLTALQDGIAPFIDGEYQYMTEGYLVCDSDDRDAVWECSQTNGHAEAIGGDNCYHCGTRMREDSFYVEAVEESICSDCLNAHYVAARTSTRRHADTTYVRADDAIELCNGESYTSDIPYFESTNGTLHNTAICDCDISHCDSCDEYVVDSPVLFTDCDGEDLCADCLADVPQAKHNSDCPCQACADATAETVEIAKDIVASDSTPEMPEGMFTHSSVKILIVSELIAVQAYVLGFIAVHRVDGRPTGAWRLSHTGTGLSLGLTWDSLADAKLAARHLSALAGWDSINNTNASTEAYTDIRDAITALKRNGVSALRTVDTAQEVGA